ncbi:unnamed protein product [Vitrella brassicaformis CCMP3155]|uniref:Uncharacterized protein n=2 Tax=Vitrella brassicaformis TaxID=1169539 RepID=A0A0G4GBV6_VITBC|nr:unnamed protein product [Vitrella brassicaformis CCMP3155]|eukprot:CEM26626.1 unnamed protein product [Vitrella brassicaformis CCMP3155]
MQRDGRSKLSTCSRGCDCRSNNRLCTDSVNCKRRTCTNFVYPLDPVVCNDDDDDSSPYAGPAVPSTASFGDDKMREAFGEPLTNSAGGSSFPEWEAYYERVCRLRLRCVGIYKTGNLGRAVADAVTDDVEAIAKLEAPSEQLFVVITNHIHQLVVSPGHQTRPSRSPGRV